MKFEGTINIVNFGKPLRDYEIETMVKNYRLSGPDQVNEINFKCKGWNKSTKPIYLQCVDWVDLIPLNFLKENEFDNFVIKLPDGLPVWVSVYMIQEIYSIAGKHPKVLEYKNDRFNRIVDLEYESNFSKKKRQADEDSMFNR